MILLTSWTAQADLQAIRLVATDMDGTLTIGKVSGTLLQSCERLTQAGIEMLIVPGRSAGWVSGLVHSTARSQAQCHNE